MIYGGVYDGKLNTDQWYPIRMASGIVPSGGIPSGSVSIYYGYEAETAISSYVPSGGEWVETGSGMYWLQIGASEFTSAGKYQVYVHFFSGGLDPSYIDIEVKTYTFEDLVNMVYTMSGNLNTTNSTVDTVSGYVNSISGSLAAVGNTLDTVSGDIASLPDSGVISSGVWSVARSNHIKAGTFGQMQQAIRTGTAQGGSTSSILLDAGASSTNDFYKNCIVHVISGTGANQSRRITAYNGSTKTATVANNWKTTPNNTAVFVVYPRAEQVADIGLDSISTLITSGNAAGWADGATAAEVWNNTYRVLTSGVTVSGLEPAALGQIVTSGDAASWSAAAGTGDIVTGIFNEVVMSSASFRNVVRDVWAYTAQQVDISGTASGIYHTYYDETPSSIYTLFINSSGRTRS